jgi:hypothetical protein
MYDVILSTFPPYTALFETSKFLELEENSQRTAQLVIRQRADGNPRAAIADEGALLGKPSQR